MTAPSADLAIRLRRAAFNRALAEGDLAAIKPILSRECVLVTGSDSAVLAGRNAQLAAWKREFAARPRTVYVRTPETVTVSTVEPIALETGQWHGQAFDQDSDQDSGQEPGLGRGSEALSASGLYSAKWRETAGEWVLEAEIFITLG